MKKILFTTLMLMMTTCLQAQSLPKYLDETVPVEQRIDDALSRMTLDEKIAVIHAQSKFSSPGVKRLGFPDLWTDDGPHGVRPDVLWDEWVQAGQTNDSCVAFPALTCLAATWNPAMARLYGESLGEEALYRKKNVILGPGVNINRTPLGGRNFEYMGEDPYLASQMVVPYVQGLQSKGVASCVKHYALNNDEEYRHQVNVKVSDRALHEIYLPAFRAAVQEGGAWAIMGAYNLYKDQHNCHNTILLNKILKHDWQFDGVVISDWGGCHDTEEAITNGLDLEFGTWTDGLTMGRTNAYDSYHMAEAYKRLILEGKYTTKELDEKVRRVLRLFYRTTMQREKPYGFLCSEAHYDAARRIAQEGIVLLKNKAPLSIPEQSSPTRSLSPEGETSPLLPLTAEKLLALHNARKTNEAPSGAVGGASILVVGENAIKMMTVGGGSSSLKVQHEILPLDGLTSYIRPLTSDIVIDYARGYVGDTIQSFDGVTVGRSLRETRSQAELRTEAVEKAKEADVVIFFGGLNKSDYQDCEGHDRKEYGLPYGQDELIEAILKVNPCMVYVNISGNAVAMPWADRVPAILQAWFLGSEAGTAIASVLFGDVNPSGKLPYTWYQRLNDCGAHALKAFPGEWRDDYKIIDEEYKEDIYVGYRWTDKQKIRPLFAFGHGLSYTTFQLGKPVADKRQMTADEKISFSVPVTNTGSRAGAETVQLYIRDVKATVDRPVKELKAFQKVFLLPGETQTVSLTIDRSALSFYDSGAGEWTAEPGKFEALIGTASDRLAGKCSFELK